MKKRIVSFALALLMVLGYAAPKTMIHANAAADSSEYLENYSIAVGTASDHRIAMTISIDGYSIMTKIGVQEIYIEQKIDGKWKEYDTMYGVDHPEFYEYNSIDYFNTIYFTGTPNVQYRVTITAYAKNSTGSDTGTLTSLTITCK